MHEVGPDEAAASGDDDIGGFKVSDKLRLSLSPEPITRIRLSLFAK